MNRKWILIFYLFCLSAFAETCPSISDIQHQSLHGFKIVDSDTNKPLHPKRVALFKDKIKEFALAEWINQPHNTGTIHCYYRDRDGSELETYLVKKHFVPTNFNNFWYSVSGAMHCAAGADHCIFQLNPLNQKQLSKK